MPSWNAAGPSPPATHRRRSPTWSCATPASSGSETTCSRQTLLTTPASQLANDAASGILTAERAAFERPVLRLVDVLRWQVLDGWTLDHLAVVGVAGAVAGAVPGPFGRVPGH